MPAAQPHSGSTVQAVWEVEEGEEGWSSMKNKKQNKKKQEENENAGLTMCYFTSLGTYSKLDEVKWLQMEQTH